MITSLENGGWAMRSLLWRWGLALLLGSGWGWAMSARGFSHGGVPVIGAGVFAR
jgi:hypothetical protein